VPHGAGSLRRTLEDEGSVDACAPHPDAVLLEADRPPHLHPCLRSSIYVYTRYLCSHIYHARHPCSTQTSPLLTQNLCTIWQPYPLHTFVVEFGSPFHTLVSLHGHGSLIQPPFQRPYAPRFLQLRTAASFPCSLPPCLPSHRSAPITTMSKGR